MTPREHRQKAHNYRRVAYSLEKRAKAAGRRGPLWDRYIALLTKAQEHTDAAKAIDDNEGDQLR